MAASDTAFGPSTPQLKIWPVCGSARGSFLVFTSFRRRCHTDSPLPDDAYRNHPRPRQWPPPGRALATTCGSTPTFCSRTTFAGRGPSAVFHREFGRDAKVWDRQKIVIIPDHYIFTADGLSNRNVDILREFVREQGLPYFLRRDRRPQRRMEVRRRPGPAQTPIRRRVRGRCATRRLPEKGHVRPGEVLFGTDSHTCMAGAFGEFATGIGNTDAGFILGTGKLLIKVPETMRFYLDGALQKGVMAKDVILHVIGEIGFDGATYRAMQWDGPGGERPLHGRPHDHRQHGHRGRAAKTASSRRTRRRSISSTRAAPPTARRRTTPPPKPGPNQKFVYEQAFDLADAGADRGHAPEPGQPRAGQDAGAHHARPRVHRQLHGRQNVGFPGVRGGRQGQAGQAGHLRGCPRHRGS